MEGHSCWACVGQQAGTGGDWGQFLSLQGIEGKFLLKLEFCLKLTDNVKIPETKVCLGKLLPETHFILRVLLLLLLLA